MPLSFCFRCCVYRTFSTGVSSRRLLDRQDLVRTQDADGNFVAQQPELPPAQAPSGLGPRSVALKQPMAPPGKAISSLACLAREVESVRQRRALEIVEQWKTGRLSVTRFSLLEATMGDKHVPKSKEALQDLTNRNSQSFASMKDLGDGARKRARSQVLSTIKELGHVKYIYATVKRKNQNIFIN